jgi:hypothetical protein
MKTKLSLLLLSFALLAVGPARAQQAFQALSSVDVLLALPSTGADSDYYCEGLHSPGDAAPATGTYHYFPTSADATNVYKVFAPSYGGRWERISPPYIDLTLNTTAAGSTNATTPGGFVTLAANTTSVTITNSFVTTTTPIVATVCTNDATAKSVAVSRVAGAFTLTLNATNTAALPVSWLILLK